MKGPFITNHKHFHSNKLSNTDAILNHIRTVVGKIDGVSKQPSCYEIPYMMLQRRLIDHSEVKLVFLDKEYSHSVRSNTTCMSFKGTTQEELVTFGNSVFEILKMHEHRFIFDGLFRIDVFKTEDGKLVVNELESLEAEYFGSDVEEARVAEFLKSYWEKKIYDCISAVCCV
jgi:hypothetical protein